MVVAGNLSAGVTCTAGIDGIEARWLLSFDFNVRQLQAIAKAEAAILFPTPSFPVKSNAWGSVPLRTSVFSSLMGCCWPAMALNPIAFVILMDSGGRIVSIFRSK